MLILNFYLVALVGFLFFRVIVNQIKVKRIERQVLQITKEQKNRIASEFNSLKRELKEVDNMY